MLGKSSMAGLCNWSRVFPCCAADTCSMLLPDSGHWQLYHHFDSQANIFQVQTGSSKALHIPMHTQPAPVEAFCRICAGIRLG